MTGSTASVNRVEEKSPPEMGTAIGHRVEAYRFSRHLLAADGGVEALGPQVEYFSQAAQQGLLQGKQLPPARGR